MENFRFSHNEDGRHATRHSARAPQAPTQGGRKRERKLKNLGFSGFCKSLFFKHWEKAKIQGTYFKISALYFEIYGLYFLRHALCFFAYREVPQISKEKTSGFSHCAQSSSVPA